MIFDIAPTFVMSRDGYILATDEVYTSFGTYQRLGPRGLCSRDAYYFPIGSNIDSTMIRVRNYLRLNYLSETVRVIGEELNDNPKYTFDKVLTNIGTAADAIMDMMTIDKSPIDFFTRLTNRGHVEIGTMEYSYIGTKIYGVPDIDVTVKTNILPLGIGTEWLACISQEHSINLEAAMRSTSTKEELLLLLRKIGAIKLGEWLTIEEFTKRKELFKTYAIVAEQVEKDVKFIMNTTNPKGIY